MRLNLKGGREAVWEIVTKTGFPCSHQYEEKICGRPLGMDFDRRAHLNFFKTFSCFIWREIDT